jgi:hypothetical protein
MKVEPLVNAVANSLVARFPLVARDDSQASDEHLRVTAVLASIQREVT